MTFTIFQRSNLDLCLSLTKENLTEEESSSGRSGNLAIERWPDGKNNVRQAAECVGTQLPCALDLGFSRLVLISLQMVSVHA